MSEPTFRSAPESREAEPSELAEIIRQSWFGFGPREDREAYDALEALLAQHERALSAAEAALRLGEIAADGWQGAAAAEHARQSGVLLGFELALREIADYPHQSATIAARFQDVARRALSSADSGGLQSLPDSATSPVPEEQP